MSFPPVLHFSYNGGYLNGRGKGQTEVEYKDDTAISTGFESVAKSLRWTGDESSRVTRAMSWFLGGLPAALVIGVFFYTKYCLYKSATGQRSSALTLAVWSGLLGLVAILVPLGSAESPWSRTVDWRQHALLEASIGVAFCAFGVAYCMITLKEPTSFELKANAHIPAWINATWVSLLWIGGCIVWSNFMPGTAEELPHPGTTTQGRFVIVHDLPELGTNRREVEAEWGTPASPALPGAQWLVYKTNGGIVVFCFDKEDLARKIVERRGTDLNAIGDHCK